MVDFHGPEAAAPARAAGPRQPRPHRPHRCLRRCPLSGVAVNPRSDSQAGEIVCGIWDYAGWRARSWSSRAVRPESARPPARGLQRRVARSSSAMSRRTARNEQQRDHADRRYRHRGRLRPRRTGSVTALFETAAGTYGGVDASFNVGADMAALRGDSDVVDIDLDLWDRVMAVNLRGLCGRDEIGHSADARARRGRDRQHVVGRGLPGRADPSRLRDREGGNRCADPSCRIPVG